VQQFALTKDRNTLIKTRVAKLSFYY